MYKRQGYIVSDSEAVEFLHTKHRITPTEEEMAAQVVNAGLNIRTNFTPVSYTHLDVYKRQDWMHSCYSAGWWSSTAGVQMGPEFGITVRLWSDLHTFVTRCV